MRKVAEVSARESSCAKWGERDFAESVNSVPQENRNCRLEAICSSSAQRNYTWLPLSGKQIRHHRLEDYSMW